jgi:hypothetical protein
MAIRKKIWIYPDANPTLGTQLENPVENTISSIAELDYLKVSATIVSAANAYIYGSIPVVGSYNIQSGDFLEYDVYWETSGNIVMGMDMHSSAGALRDGVGATDTNGRGAHPATNLTSVASGKWYRRKIPITTFSGGSSVGTAVTFYNIACEVDSSGTYVSRFKNMAITDGNGVAVDNLTSFATFF